LKVSGNVARPYYGGKTHFKDGSAVPDNFDARLHPQVIHIDSILQLNYSKIHKYNSFFCFLK